MSSLLQDARYAVRTLVQSPKFSIAAIIILAVGIGANTAIFSIMDAVLLRSLPFPNPDRLVQLYETEPVPGNYPFAGPDFADWKAQNRTFSSMSLYQFKSNVNLNRGGNAYQAVGVPTDASFFSLLGTAPLYGRTWVQGEDQPGKNDAAILSYALWQRLFNGDPEAVGQTIELDAVKHRIVGVMPREFKFPFSDAELWTPMDASAQGLGARGNHSFSAIGRMKPGVSLGQSRTDLSLIAARLEKDYPGTNYKIGAVVNDLREELVGDTHESLYMMLAAVGLVLLIACANVANLLLTRAMARQKEMAVRHALGASPSRLVRQLLTESVLLALVSGILGLALGAWLIHLAPHLKSYPLPNFNPVRLSGAVLAFTMILSIATGVLFGLAPAFQIVQSKAQESLSGGAGSALSPSRRRRRLMKTLVAAETAFSMLLLIPTGLLLKDFVSVHNLNIGVRRTGIWTGSISLPDASYKTIRQRTDFTGRLLDQLRRIPGVKTASLSSHLPLEGGMNGQIQVHGRIAAHATGPLVEGHDITPEYFRALGIPLLKGRIFNDADVQLTHNQDAFLFEAWQKKSFPSEKKLDLMVFPAVINETMANTFWPHEEPLGKMFAYGGKGPWRQVIGVVSDVKQRGMLTIPRPEAYRALYAARNFQLILHTTVSPSSVEPSVRRALAGIDNSLALAKSRTMEDIVADSMRSQRFLSALAGAFALLAALLAVMGIYGVISYMASHRTREIGIRLSLGATRWQILAGFLREGMVLAFTGSAAGLAGAFAARRIMASLLHQVKSNDPAVFAAAACLLLAVAWIACVLPARRAARLDPVRALRRE